MHYDSIMTEEKSCHFNMTFYIMMSAVSYNYEPLPVHVVFFFFFLKYAVSFFSFWKILVRNVSIQY